MCSQQLFCSDLRNSNTYSVINALATRNPPEKDPDLITAADFLVEHHWEWGSIS